MGVKVRERNDDPGAWWLYISYHGHRKAKRVGFGPKAKKAAEAAAVQIQAKLAQGELSCFADASERLEHALDAIRNAIDLDPKQASARPMRSMRPAPPTGLGSRSRTSGSTGRG